ncbi:hypothetical protein JOE30_001311 [Rhodococcus sp. PvP016]|uniref:ANTAR domain-containing protein n=2 Tax=Mycobacteriales TaxID=85007 RepID=A0ABS2KZN7_9NOCA|nr:hypothetical protein [Rhodococcus corynebacterioides]MBP1115514.1 hypothetical protein [Rhodococcus sp. PvP016]
MDSMPEDPTRDDDRHGASRDGASSFTGIRHVTETSVRLTGVDGAAVALLGTSHDVRELVFATDALSQQLDELQFTVGEGPCIDAHRSAEPVRVGDIRSPDSAARWPIFGQGAATLGARGMYAYPLLGGASSFGVLELYRSTPVDLTDVEHDAARMCAVAIARTVLGHYVNPDGTADAAAPPEDALASEDVAAIEGAGPYSRADVYVAAGMIAVQLAVTTDVAMDRLRAHAFARGLSVTEVAADVVARRISMRAERDNGGPR